MKQHSDKLNGFDCLLVEVPEGTFDLGVVHSNKGNKLTYYFKNKDVSPGQQIFGLNKIPEGFSILGSGLVSAITEEEAKILVTKDAHYSRSASFNPEYGHYQSSGSSTTYKDHSTGRCTLDYATESLFSYVRCKGFDINTTVALIKK
jgi:hypothetical protein